MKPIRPLQAGKRYNWNSSILWDNYYEDESYRDVKVEDVIFPSDLVRGLSKENDEQYSF